MVLAYPQKNSTFYVVVVQTSDQQTATCEPHAAISRYNCSPKKLKIKAAKRYLPIIKKSYLERHFVTTHDSVGDARMKALAKRGKLFIDGAILEVFLNSVGRSVQRFKSKSEIVKKSMIFHCLLKQYKDGLQKWP